MLKIIIIIIQICLIGFAQDSGEKYITKEVAFIPYGEVDSLLGFIPGGPERNEQGEIVHVEPGEAVRSWDIGLDGKIYLADGVKRRVSVYDSTGHYIRSIGVWDQDTNKIEIRATSGTKRVIFVQWPPNAGKRYFFYPSDIAVDGAGNVYVIPRLSANYLMKFSPEGKLLEIIDKFGEYGREEIRDIGFDIRSDAYGDIIVGMITKSEGRTFATLDKRNQLISITKGMLYPVDSSGNLYIYLKSDKKWNEPKSQISISVKNPNKEKQDTISIYFDPPTRSTFKGVDAEGNLYFSGGCLYKYDQKGNLLVRIYVPREFFKKYTFKIPLAGMAAVSKIMEDGSIYNVVLSDQGVIVYKMSIKPGTKGQILKPAVKPEKN